MATISTQQDVNLQSPNIRRNDNSQILDTEVADKSALQRPIDTLHSEEVDHRVADANMEQLEESEMGPNDPTILQSFGRLDANSPARNQNLKSEEEDDDNVW